MRLRRSCSLLGCNLFPYILFPYLNNMHLTFFLACLCYILLKEVEGTRALPHTGIHRDVFTPGVCGRAPNRKTYPTWVVFTLGAGPSERNARLGVFWMRNGTEHEISKHTHIGCIFRVQMGTEHKNTPKKWCQMYTEWHRT